MTESASRVERLEVRVEGKVILVSKKPALGAGYKEPTPSTTETFSF